MQIPKEFTTVTGTSKFLALVLFILFPFIGFAFGMRYQAAITRGGESVQPTYPPIPSQGVMCTADVKICPDGTTVSREGPNCEFAPCPEGIITRETPAPPDVSGTRMSKCFDDYGALMSDEACKNVPLEARRCNTDADCSPSCSRGCVSSLWTPPVGEIECMSQPMYSCACVNNECRKAQ
jgi:hypothetical protein